MMQKVSKYFGFGIAALLLVATLPLHIAAQDRGTDREMFENLGYGLEPGQAVIIIVSDEFSTQWDGRGAIPPGPVEVTGAPTGAAAVGSCHTDELPMQAGVSLDPDGEGDPVPGEIAILYPDGVELPVGTTLGAWRSGGPCGPGYQILYGHLLLQ